MHSKAWLMDNKGWLISEKSVGTSHHWTASATHQPPIHVGPLWLVVSCQALSFTITTIDHWAVATYAGVNRWSHRLSVRISGTWCKPVSPSGDFPPIIEQNYLILLVFLPVGDSWLLSTMVPAVLWLASLTHMNWRKKYLQHITNRN